MFRWSWKLGTVAGIGVYVHWTFLLLLVWVIASGLIAGETAVAVAVSVALILAIFASVVLHELGHALTARRFGVGAHAITLLPIGGVSSLERIPDRPRQELWIAIVGPLVSLAIAGVIAVGLWLAGEPRSPDTLLRTGDDLAVFLAQLMWINVLLAIFNMLPAFPLDGGRVLRAVLAMRLGATRATRIAAGLGRALAIVLALIGLNGSPMLVIIAVFVWLAAGGEAAAVENRAELAGVPVSRAMITDFHALDPGEPLRAVVERILGGFQDAFPVIASTGLVGVITREDVIRGLARSGPEVPVSAVMRPAALVEPWMTLDAAVEELRARNVSMLVVVEDGRVRGLVTPGHVAELIDVRRAARKLHAIS